MRLPRWYYIAAVGALLLACSDFAGATPKHHNSAAWIDYSTTDRPCACPSDPTGGSVCNCPLLEHPTTVTLAAPWQIDGQDGNVILEGGTMSFDGKQWTYKGDFHGSGTIVFRAPISHRE